MNNGIPINGTSFSPGIVDQAFSLDGVDDFVDLGTWQNTNALTIEAWIYSNGFAGRSWRDVVVLDPDLGARRNLIVQSSSGRLTAYPGFYGTTVLSPGQWYHVAFTHDGSLIRIFVNGSLDGSFPNAIPPISVSTATLGNWPGFNEYWNGLIDELSVYDRALSVSEILSIYQAGAGGKCSPDDEAPVTTGTTANPNPVVVNAPVTLTALVDDVATGGSSITSAEYSLDEGTTWTVMSAVDGSFDGVAENVTAPLAFTHPTVSNACVRGTDAAGNIGIDECVLVAVFDPTAGFATGAGWIDSPGGAYVADPALVGKAHFAFVSKYAKGKTVPDGNASFRFKVADLDFESTSYEWLVVNQGGTNAQFKGSGTINGGLAPNGTEFRFMIWARDASPDTFRIKIWYENGGEVVVYDNGHDQPIGAGSIKVHM